MILGFTMQLDHRLLRGKTTAIMREGEVITGEGSDDDAIYLQNPGPPGISDGPVYKWGLE